MGRSEQTGSDCHCEDTNANLEEELQQKSSKTLCSSAEGSEEQSLEVAKIFPEKGSAEFSSFGRDVLLFCRVNPKEPYVFMGRSYLLSYFSISDPLFGSDSL